MADITITISVEVSPLIDCKIDDNVIESWLEARLDDARNTFITNSSGSGGGRGGASAPGEYPAVQTGRLIGSIEVEVAGRAGDISSPVEYAGYLTTGTSKMEARLMLADALDESLSARPEAAELAKAATFTTGGG